LTLETLKDSLKNSKVPSEDIAMISFSSQMHGITFTDKDGVPLTNLITWLDRRVVKETIELKKNIDSYELYKRTGCPLLFIYPLAKILWAQKNIPKKFERCRKILSAKGYILNRMLGSAYVDRSLASGTQLLNIHDLEWDKEVLNIAGIKPGMLPTLANETEIIGELSGKIAKITGLKKGTPVIPGGSDGALSNLGLGAVQKGVAAINIGTSGALRILSDKPFIDVHRDARFFCYYTALGHWLPGGAISNAGNILRWYRDNLGMGEVIEAEKRGVDPYEVILEKAAAIKPGAEGLFMLPFFSGERFPIRNPKAKGVIFGLSLSHGTGHLARAIVESVVYTLRWVMETMEKHGALIDEVRSGGGGARTNYWRQIQADILGKPVAHTKVEEASALGAAMLAALKLGVYKDLADASENMVRTVGYHNPNYEKHQKYLRMFKLYKELYSASERFYEELSSIDQ
jgi:gluconokinase